MDAAYRFWVPRPMELVPSQQHRVDLGQDPGGCEVMGLGFIMIIKNPTFLQGSPVPGNLDTPFLSMNLPS